MATVTNDRCNWNVSNLNPVPITYSSPMISNGEWRPNSFVGFKDPKIRNGG